MPIRAHVTIAAAIVAVSAALITTLLTAGPLDPPAGPVAPSYKTLSEVEPRTAINAANTPGDDDSIYRITQPGSYYLPGNLSVGTGKVGIEIASNNVTIDLKGFSIDGSSGGAAGIVNDGSWSAITIRDGSLSTFPQGGIDLSHGAISGGALIENVRVRLSSIGIKAGAAATVRNCTADNNVAAGITAGAASRIEHCIATGSTQDGINATASVVADCLASYNATGINVTNGCTVERACAEYGANGILAIESTITGCVMRNSTGFGMYVSNSLVSGCTSTHCSIAIFADQSRVENCQVSTNGVGIDVQKNCRITGNLLHDNATGMFIEGGANHIEGNTATASADWGFLATLAGNLFLRNTAAANNPNWDIAAGNNCLVVNAVDGPAFAGSAGGVPIGSTDPNANFSY